MDFGDNAPLAQLVEQVLRKDKVGGSSPSWGTTSLLVLIDPQFAKRE